MSRFYKPYDPNRGLYYLYVNEKYAGLVLKHNDQDMVAIPNPHAPDPAWKTPQDWAIERTRKEIAALQAKITPLEEYVTALVQPELFTES